MKIKILQYENEQILFVDDKIIYNVYNLNDCPEDAIIGRGLTITE